MDKVLTIRIRERGSKGHGTFEYKNEIPLNDWKQVALLFVDLERFGGKIDKAFREFQKEKAELQFPF